MSFQAEKIDQRLRAQNWDEMDYNLNVCLAPKLRNEQLS